MNSRKCIVTYTMYT